MGTTQLDLSVIRLDGGTQTRAALSQQTVDEYAEAIAGGAVFPPVVVFFDGTTYVLADGFHRVAAAKVAGLVEFAADVRQGDARAARLHAAGANLEHGLRRSNADKRAAVMVLLTDAEWSTWSDREIARRCGVSQPFVGKVRAELAAGDNGYHPSETRVGADGKTYPASQPGKTRRTWRADLRETFKSIRRGGPASICTCGHTGDGARSQHLDGWEYADGVEEGHGKCAVDGCACEHFHWSAWTPAAKVTLDQAYVPETGSPELGPDPEPSYPAAEVMEATEALQTMEMAQRRVQLPHLPGDRVTMLVAKTERGSVFAYVVPATKPCSFWVSIIDLRGGEDEGSTTFFRVPIPKWWVPHAFDRAWWPAPSEGEIDHWSYPPSEPWATLPFYEKSGLVLDGVVPKAGGQG